jgi:hypothetical protein
VRKKASKSWRFKVKAEKCAESVIEEWNLYLGGNVYNYDILDMDGESIESCGGFYCELYGKEPYIITEAKSVIDHIIKRKLKEHAEYLKHLINGKVNISHREASGF